MSKSLVLVCASPLLLCATPAFADQASGGHDAGLSEIVVTAAPYARDRNDVLQNTSVIDAEALDRSVRGSIGETLSSLPGVAATSFGPGASRPVLRGLQGERVRVLTDGIGTIDVGNTSADHAVAVDPLIADRIEVVRGPATLLYGSSALGGVVNVVSRRVPQTMPDAPLALSARAGFASAANERFAGGAADITLGGPLVAHVDASALKSGDLAIPGYAKSHRLRDLEGGEDEDAVKDSLPNSDVRTVSAGAGLSFIGERGYFGAAVSVYDTNYGIAGGTVVVGVPTGEAEEEEEGVRIDLHQTRVDIGGRLTFDSSAFDSIQGRFGYADYEHKEVEGSGEVGTRFNNLGWEGRLELVQRQRGGWRGALGVQASHRDFEAIGEEAFVPPNVTSQQGLFILQEWAPNPLKLEAAARIEHTSVTSDTLGYDRDFTTLSGSAGAAYSLAEGWSLGLTASRSVRAPAAEELLADGPHAATGTYEIGNPDFATEKGIGLEGSLKGRGDAFDVTLSVYWNRFDDFIVETATGGVEDGLPVFQFIQTDARTLGAEVDVSARLFERGDWKLIGDLVGDITRGHDLDADQPLPRMPQTRAKVGLESQSTRFDARAEIEIVGEQTRVSAYELPTDGYEMVNLSLAYRPFGRDRDITLLFQANNLTDVDARRSTSFLKDTVPLAGRDLRLSLQAGF